jgi:hypothetical protein
MLQARNRFKPANAARCIFPVFRRLCTTLGHNSDSDGEEVEYEYEFEDELAGKSYNTQYKVSYINCNRSARFHEEDNLRSTSSTVHGQGSD